jgi:hypothetical protein
MTHFLDTLNGADLVACGILAVGALCAFLYLAMEYTPRLFWWAVVRLDRWHAAQVVKANTPVRWEDRK